MPLTYKELKKNKIDHFFFINPTRTFGGEQFSVRIDVVANKRMYLGDMESKEDIEEFMKKYQCYATEEEAWNAQNK